MPQWLGYISWELQASVLSAKRTYCNTVRRPRWLCIELVWCWYWHPQALQHQHLCWCKGTCGWYTRFNYESSTSDEVTPVRVSPERGQLFNAKEGGTQWSKPLLLPLLQFTSKVDFVALVCVDNGRQGMVAVHLLTLEQFVSRSR